MPRTARLDAPRRLHHVMVRGIERRHMVDEDQEGRDFVSRMGTVVVEGASSICAWALMTNHMAIRKLASESLDGQTSIGKGPR
jgi:putative transposase